MENAHLGHRLLTAVRQNPLITLIDGASVTHIEQNDVCVTLRVQKNPNNAQAHANPCDDKGLTNHENAYYITGTLLVACDGQHSTARTLLGVTAYKSDYGQTAVVGIIKTQKPHKHTAIECFSPLGPLALLPLTIEVDKKTQKSPCDTGNYRSVVWICKTNKEARYLNDEQFFMAQLQKVFGERVGGIIKVGKRGAYPLVKVLADKQVIGRCVLMGNAAHTLHPVAGQGFNLCMRDAEKLACMLGATSALEEDLADYYLLKAYEAERLGDQKRVILFCDMVIYSFCSPNPLLKLCRNIGLIVFDKVPKIKPMVARFAMGLKSSPSKGGRISG